MCMLVLARVALFVAMLSDSFFHISINFITCWFEIREMMGLVAKS